MAFSSVRGERERENGDVTDLTKFGTVSDTVCVPPGSVVQ